MTHRKSSGGKKKQKAKRRKQNAAPPSILQPVDTNKNGTALPDDTPASATSSENSKGLIENTEFVSFDLNLSGANTSPPRDVFNKNQRELCRHQPGLGVEKDAAAPDATIPTSGRGVGDQPTSPPVELSPDSNILFLKSLIADPVLPRALLAQDSGFIANTKELKFKPLDKMATPRAQADAPNGVDANVFTYTEVAAAPPPPEQNEGNVDLADSSRRENEANLVGNGARRQPSSPPSSSCQSNGHAIDNAHPEPIPELRALGLRWAPLNVPFERRLQTLVVLAHCLSIAITTSIFFFICVNPLLWPIIIVYLVKISVSTAHCDGNLSRRSNFARRLPVWKLFASYFPARLHKTADLPPTRKYIFGYHPHGIISHGAWAAFATEALGFSEVFPGITNTVLTLDSNFRIPVYRDYILAMGLGSVSKESIVNTLTKGGRNGEGMGRAVTIVVGGAREALEARPGNLSLILKDRKGFIRMAMRTGADLVPVVGFGENELYMQLYHRDHPLIRRMQLWVLRVLKFTLPILRGRGIFNYDVGMMPFRHPMNVVVGRPIKVNLSPRDQAPNNDEVDRLHSEYIAELERMWEEHKDRFAKNRTAELKILA